MRSRAGTLGMRLALAQRPQDFAEALGEPAQNRTFDVAELLLQYGADAATDKIAV